MKALIISDQQEIINSISPKLKAQGYDIIVYRWLLKALDNVEEIQPDYIILSASEYPRQWKTLASYVASGIGGYDVKFSLFDSDSLSEEDKKKAFELQVDFWEDEKEEPVAEEPVVEEPVVEEPVVEEPVVEEPVVEEPAIEEPAIEEPAIEEPANYSIILTHPLNGKFITGTAIKTSADCFECKIERSGFMIKQNIKYVSVSCGEDVISFSGEVQSFVKDSIIIKVKDYYEK